MLQWLAHPTAQQLFTIFSSTYSAHLFATQNGALATQLRVAIYSQTGLWNSVFCLFMRSVVCGETDTDTDLDTGIHSIVTCG